MSLITQVMVAEKYGLRLNMEQLAEVLGLAKGTVYNQTSRGECPVKTYVDCGKRWADFRDVAEYFDRVREQAA
jgi:predicted DNA-binding transcriptional regulator AlpA